MISWIDFIGDHEDFIGGNIELLNQDGCFRGLIKTIELQGSMVLIHCEWVAKCVLDNEEDPGWEKSDYRNPLQLPMHFFFLERLSRGRIGSAGSPGFSVMFFPNYTIDNLDPVQVRGLEVSA